MKMDMLSLIIGVIAGGMVVYCLEENVRIPKVSRDVEEACEAAVSKAIDDYVKMVRSKKKEA